MGVATPGLPSSSGPTVFQVIFCSSCREFWACLEVNFQCDVAGKPPRRGIRWTTETHSFQFEEARDLLQASSDGRPSASKTEGQFSQFQPQDLVPSARIQILGP
ncbi:hypothetical protein ATANTOWER_002192 [Ataeniobius toweri]|uniref:Uncharacterized protein n=1 Tax=Ataeniobius toweri TaxID=208326 RepID=A0ABU7A3V3_9TELE|nr:hypothetical protein [Ataeniobius toweri]